MKRNTAIAGFLFLCVSAFGQNISAKDHVAMASTSDTATFKAIMSKYNYRDYPLPDDAQCKNPRYIYTSKSTIIPDSLNSHILIWGECIGFNFFNTEFYFTDVKDYIQCIKDFEAEGFVYSSKESYIILESRKKVNRFVKSGIPGMLIKIEFENYAPEQNTTGYIVKVYNTPN
jgi:hypothetical protein